MRASIYRLKSIREKPHIHLSDSGVWVAREPFILLSMSSNNGLNWLHACYFAEHLNIKEGRYKNG